MSMTNEQAQTFLDGLKNDIKEHGDETDFSPLKYILKKIVDKIKEYL